MIDGGCMYGRWKVPTSESRRPNPNQTSNFIEGGCTLESRVQPVQDCAASIKSLQTILVTSSISSTTTNPRQTFHAQRENHAYATKKRRKERGKPKPPRTWLTIENPKHSSRIHLTSSHLTSPLLISSRLWHWLLKHWNTGYVREGSSEPPAR